VLVVGFLNVMVVLDELKKVKARTHSSCETHEEGTEQNDTEAVRFS
jgi:hypothetical protein